MATTSEKTAVQRTLLEGVTVIVPADDTGPEAPWRRVVNHLGRLGYVLAAAEFAWRAKSHRDQAVKHAQLDAFWTGQVRERLDKGGIGGLVKRLGKHRVSVSMRDHTPTLVTDPVGLITALGPLVGETGLVTGLSVDRQVLGAMLEAHPELADTVEDCFGPGTPSRPVTITRLA
jgi:hypothetical protein